MNWFVDWAFGVDASLGFGVCWLAQLVAGGLDALDLSNTNTAPGIAATLQRRRQDQHRHHRQKHLFANTVLVPHRQESNASGRHQAALVRSPIQFDQLLVWFVCCGRKAWLYKYGTNIFKLKKKNFNYFLLKIWKLLYLSAVSDPYEGFLRALSVSQQAPMPRIEPKIQMKVQTFNTWV